MASPKATLGHSQDCDLLGQGTENTQIWSTWNHVGMASHVVSSNQSLPSILASQQSGRKNLHNWPHPCDSGSRGRGPMAGTHVIKCLDAYLDFCPCKAVLLEVRLQN